MERVIKKSGKQLCGMAKMAAVISVNSCRGFFYQPEEPKGVKILAEKRKVSCKNKDEVTE